MQCNKNKNRKNIRHTEKKDLDKKKCTYLSEDTPTIKRRSRVHSIGFYRNFIPKPSVLEIPPSVTPQGIAL